MNMMLLALPLLAVVSCKQREFNNDSGVKDVNGATNSVAFLYGTYSVSQEDCTDKKLDYLQFPYSRTHVRDELVSAGRLDVRDPLVAGLRMGTNVTIVEGPDKTIPQISVKYKLRYETSVPPPNLPNGERDMVSPHRTEVVESDEVRNINIAPLIRDEVVTIGDNKVSFEYRKGGLTGTNFSSGTVEKKPDGSLLVSYKSGYRYVLPLPGWETFEGSCLLKPVR
jgi:hypothetical protein